MPFPLERCNGFLGYTELHTKKQDLETSDLNISRKFIVLRNLKFSCREENAQITLPLVKKKKNCPQVFYYIPHPLSLLSDEEKSNNKSLVLSSINMYTQSLGT